MQVDKESFQKQIKKEMELCNSEWFEGNDEKLKIYNVTKLILDSDKDIEFVEIEVTNL